RPGPDVMLARARGALEEEDDRPGRIGMDSTQPAQHVLGKGERNQLGGTPELQRTSATDSRHGPEYSQKNAAASTHKLMEKTRVATSRDVPAGRLAPTRVPRPPGPGAVIRDRDAPDALDAIDPAAAPWRTGAARRGLAWACARSRSASAGNIASSPRRGSERRPRAAGTLRSPGGRPANAARTGPGRRAWRPRRRACYTRRMRTLVTGGTGFTGSHLVRRLLARGDAVRVLDAAPGLFHDELRALGAEITLGSVTDAALVDRAVAGSDVVFHLAAAFRKINLPRREYWEVNCQGTRYVAEACLRHQVRRLVYCSTQGVHGHVARPPGDESSPIAPEDYYQQTKYEGELALWEVARQGLEASVVRPMGIYGPGDPGRFLMLFRAV